MEYEVALTPKARRDLAAIWNYIADDNRSAATTFCLELARRAYSLNNFPDRSTELRLRSSVRKLPHKNYLIFYKVDEQLRRVQILRFWHAARDQRRLRLKEEAPTSYQLAKVGA